MVEAIRNIINQSDKALFDVKNKLKEEKDKSLLKVQEQLPTKDDIMSKIKAETCSTEASNAVDKNFNNIKDKLNSINSKLEEGIKKLQALGKKLDKIKEWMNKIKTILDFIRPIVKILNLVIKVLPLSLNVLTAMFANGLAIKKLSDLIDLAKSKIKIIVATTATFESAVLRFLAKVGLIFGIIDMAIAALEKVMDFLGSLLSMLEQLYLFYLAQCNLPSNPVNSDGSLNEGILDLVIDGLQVGGKEEIIEKIYNANFETIGYSRYKI